MSSEKSFRQTKVYRPRSPFDKLKVVVREVPSCLIGVMLVLWDTRPETLRQVGRLSGYIGVVLAAISIVKVVVFD